MLKLPTAGVSHPPDALLPWPRLRRGGRTGVVRGYLRRDLDRCRPERRDRSLTADALETMSTAGLGRALVLLGARAFGGGLIALRALQADDASRAFRCGAGAFVLGMVLMLIGLIAGVIEASPGAATRRAPFDDRVNSR
ncbi:MAG: hypothetical protein IPG91_14255 [Ideonella sp.]|nr:hypothetical protein [Ideonella sp.]